MYLVPESESSSQPILAARTHCVRCGKQLYQDLDGLACWSCGWHDYRQQQMRAVLRRDADLEQERLGAAAWGQKTSNSEPDAIPALRRRRPVRSPKTPARERRRELSA